DMCPKNMAEPGGSLVLRPLLFVLVVIMSGCTANLPPGSSPPTVAQAGQVSQQPTQQKPIKQKECTAGFGDPCSTCMLKCAPGGDVCGPGVGDNAAIGACIRANCMEVCKRYAAEQE